MPSPNKFILLVEDSADEAFLFRRACVKASVSFGLNVARDGYEALAYLKGEGEYVDREKFPLPTAIVLDLNMPGISGFEVLKWIRGSPLHQHLVVIIFSASSLESDVRKAYTLAANSYLIKPINPLALVEIATLIERYWINLNLTLDVFASADSISR